MKQPEAVVENQLDFWEALGKMHDTYGLPNDIIWCRLRDTDRLPRNKNGQPMDSEEFDKGMKQAVAFLQGGGWRIVMNQVQQTLINEH